MKIKKFNDTAARKFQEGGQMVATEAAPAEEPMPAEGGEQDPLMMIAQIFAQGLQEQNCEMLAKGAQAFLEMLQQSASAEQAQPVFRKGGKLVRK